MAVRPSNTLDGAGRAGESREGEAVTFPASCTLVPPADRRTLDIRLSTAPLPPRNAAPKLFIPDNAPTPSLPLYDPFEDNRRPGRGRGKVAVASFGLGVDPFITAHLSF